jgi:hypothetical protein
MTVAASPPPRIRAGTHLGRPTPRPTGAYEPPLLVQDGALGLEVTVLGEDGRRRTFRMGHFPLPLWHRPLAEAFADCAAAHGTIRTIGTAAHTWFALKVFLTFLNGMTNPPSSPPELTGRHLDRYLFARRQTVSGKTAVKQLQAIGTVLRKIDPPEGISDEAVSWLDRRRPGITLATPSGYSDREFDAIMAAARSEVVTIRNRLQNGQRLIATLNHEPESLAPDERKLAAILKDIATTGSVPVSLRTKSNYRAARRQFAEHLFLGHHDLGPLLTLAVGLSGRNAESIKELSATHEVLEDKAVRVELVKRRRGPSGMFDTVHWEIGTASQQLHTPGGFYLLLAEMTRLSRSFSRTSSLWSIWHGDNHHIAPFDAGLHRGYATGRWRTGHPLLDDDGQPLTITLPRLKKTVDVRTTRATGGHLPSSVRSNTMPVLFSNYLRGDSTVRDWADGVITAALSDAENDARIAHARVLTTSSSVTPEPKVIAEQLKVPHGKAQQLVAGELDTAFAACADIDDGPFNHGARCSVSFLTCLGCHNALVTHAHIPRLKALLNWLVEQREKLDLDLWWRRHGLTWRAITEHIRPKFTPAEWDQVAADDLTELMALIDGPQDIV